MDNTISHLRQCFPIDLKNALLAVHLVPAKLQKLGLVEIQQLEQEFNADLPDPHCLSQEVGPIFIVRSSNFKHCLTRFPSSFN